MWETKIAINKVKEIRVKTTVYLGVGAIKKIDNITQELKEKGIRKISIITGRSAYKITGAWEYVINALENTDINYVHYDRVIPNPTVDQVDEATQMVQVLLCN